MLLATSIAFSACDGGERGAPREPAASRLADPAARARGAALFAEHCALCHGASGAGEGMRRTGFPRPPADLRDPAWQRRATPRAVFRVIREGVPASGMPAWVALDDEQTWDLVAHVLALDEAAAP